MEKRLHIYDELYLNSIITFREFEDKLGQKVETCKNTNSKDLATNLEASQAKYVLVGLPEDIGVRANFGRGGTQTCWEQALKNILNIQSNTFLKGNELLILGHLDFRDLMSQADNIKNDIKTMRELTHEIDLYVTELIRTIITSGKEAIVIGGGHNNSYGCIKGTSLALNKNINCINCDAHTDYRPKEGRHSGNGFRYAHEEGFLNRYVMIGLQENYISQTVLSELKSNSSIEFIFFEDIFIRNKISFKDAIQKNIAFIYDNPCGLELDLDAIENVATSAISPSGISATNARQYIHLCATQLPIKYVHFAEGAPILSGIKDNNGVGKLIAYLVTDFIKARNQYHSKV